MTVGRDVLAPGSLGKPSLFGMMLSISVPVENERANLPSVSHAAVTYSDPANVQVLGVRICLLNQLFWSLPGHLESLIPVYGSSLEWDSHCCDGTRERCAYHSHRSLERG